MLNTVISEYRKELNEFRYKADINIAIFSKSCSKSYSKSWYLISAGIQSWTILGYFDSFDIFIVAIYGGQSNLILTLKIL